MKSTLKFLFNLLRNLSLVFTLCFAALTIWFYSDPIRAERLLTNWETRAEQQQDLSDHMIISSQGDDSGSKQTLNKRIKKLSIGQQRLFFTPEEFAYAETSGEKYLEIYLSDGTNHRYRISIKALKEQLDSMGLETYRQQSVVVNPAYVRAIAQSNQYKDTWHIKLKHPFARNKIPLPSKNRPSIISEIETLIQRANEEE